MPAPTATARKRQLVTEARRNRVAGWTPSVLNAEKVLPVLTTALDIVLNDNGQCEREPSSDRAVVSRLLAALIATIEDTAEYFKGSAVICGPSVGAE